MTFESRRSDEHFSTMSLMATGGLQPIIGRRSAPVAVMAIRSLDDLAGGAGRYRVNWTSSVGERRHHVRTVLGARALGLEVNAWLSEVVSGSGPRCRDDESLDEHTDDKVDPM